jgi:dTDP-4-amino-4,6-dideoxygalactose transaminase
MRVPFLDVAALSAEVREESLQALTRVYDRGHYILGPEVEAFEQECGAWFGDKARCVGVSNGTDALVCALTACGIGRGHRVLTTPLTFFATASAICRVGATPVFADVEEETFLMSAAAVDDVGPVDAVVPVHLFGRMVDIGELRVRLSGVPIVEDAAQAWGATHQGEKVGTRGDAACFSFFPAKPLGACGDAGLVVTGRADVEGRCRGLRAHGREREGEFQRIGGNYRLDEMQAALLRVRLRRAEGWIERRRHHASIYIRELSSVEGLTLPRADTLTEQSAWSVFSLRIQEGREELKQFLSQRGIGTAVYYSTPVHLQPALSELIEPGQLPIAERLSRELLALPVGPELTTSQLEYVCESVRAFFE